MTANKDYKRIVRDTARRTGQSYAAVQERLRDDGTKPSTERRSMNIVRTIPDARSLSMPASRAFYEGVLGFNIAMEHAGMMILASETQPKQQVSVNADAADAKPLPPGFAVDVATTTKLFRGDSLRLAVNCPVFILRRQMYGRE
jgi:hypothetical protein